MPITKQQRRANALYQEGWRTAKHLRSGKLKGPGKAFLVDLKRAVRFGWLRRKTPEWGKGLVWYRLTTKGRKYLKKKRYKAALDAFQPTLAIKLRGSLDALQRQGWFSVKHVGQVDGKLVDRGYYEKGVRLRIKRRGTFFRLTSAGKAWAGKTLRGRMEAGLRAEFAERRMAETKLLETKLKDPAQVILAWKA
jgi:hypothetical protein